MTKQQIKKYADKRYKEISANNPHLTRAVIVNIILQELREDYKIVLTTPFGQRIIHVIEDLQGLRYEVESLNRR